MALSAVEAERIVRAYFDRLLNQRDLGVCDELLSADYLDHDAGPAPRRLRPMSPICSTRTRS